MKNLGVLCIIAGVAVLALGVILRVTHIQPLVNNPVPGLWRISESLLLIAIAIGVNKQ
jgi:hypothetical protein